MKSVVGVFLSPQTLGTQLETISHTKVAKYALDTFHSIGLIESPRRYRSTHELVIMSS